MRQVSRQASHCKETLSHLLTHALPTFNFYTRFVLHFSKILYPCIHDRTTLSVNSIVTGKKSR